MCYIRFTFCKSMMAPRVGEPNGLKGRLVTNFKSQAELCQGCLVCPCRMPPEGGLKGPLLIGVKLKVEKRQRVLVLGPNGAGKTTALKVPSGCPSHPPPGVPPPPPPKCPLAVLCVSSKLCRIVLGVLFFLSWWTHSIAAPASAGCSTPIHAVTFVTAWSVKCDQ